MEQSTCKEHRDPFGEPCFFSDPEDRQQQQTNKNCFEQEVHLVFKMELIFSKTEEGRLRWMNLFLKR